MYIPIQPGPAGELRVGIGEKNCREPRGHHRLDKLVECEGQDDFVNMESQSRESKAVGQGLRVAL